MLGQEKGTLVTFLFLQETFEKIIPVYYILGLISIVMVIFSVGCDNIVLTKVTDKGRDIGSKMITQIVKRIKL